MGKLNQLHKQYKDKAEFFLVYIKEAHPTDGWSISPNDFSGVEVDDPTSFDERVEVAGTCAANLDVSFTTLIDDMENTACKLYNAWPDRIFVVDKDGKISYRGGIGPFGFKVNELEKHLAEVAE